MKSQLRKSRLLAYSLMIGWLTLVWVLLWGQLSWGNVLAGVLLAIFVMFAFPLPGMDFNGRFRPLAILNLIAHMAFDLSVTSLQVVKQAIVPGPRIESVVVGVRLHTHNELLMTWIAICITLTPGSVIVEAHQTTGDLYVHLLGVTSPADIEKARARIFKLEYRIVHAFGSKREFERCKQFATEMAAVHRQQQEAS